MGTFSGRVGRYCPSSSGARARVGWSGTWYSLSGLFLGAIRGLENIISFDRGTCPVGGGGGPGTWGLLFSVAGRADAPSQPRWPRVPGCGRGRGEGRIEAT